MFYSYPLFMTYSLFRRSAATLLVAAFAATNMVAGLPALAAEHSVVIDGVVLSRCGEQNIAFSGVATYGAGAQHLLVDLDGTRVANLGTTISWLVMFESVPVGTHTLTARVHDVAPDLNATDILQFEVLPCQTEQKDDSNNSEEPDCCPGKDPEVTPPVKAKVKGTTTKVKASFDILKPINYLFRLAFGFTPSFAEWKYWADRLLSDKPQLDALFGAMQSQKLEGKTMGII